VVDAQDNEVASWPLVSGKELVGASR